MIRGAVLGSPITHSLSPRLHRAAFSFLGVEGSYEPIEVPAGSLSSFIEHRGGDFDYFSLTMPLKEEVLLLPIDRQPLITKIQSGNTLWKKDGNWSLTSTDGSGFLAALAYAGLQTSNRVLILGAGGTARAVAGAMDGISKEIHVLGRSSVRALSLIHISEPTRLHHIMHSRIKLQWHALLQSVSHNLRNFREGLLSTLCLNQ